MSVPSQPPGVSTVLCCGEAARARWGALLSDAAGTILGVAERPGRGDVDPLLDDLPGRLVVAGSDAALAAVMTRLLRRERLDVAVALLPDPDSVAAVVWRVPTEPDAAVALARRGSARRSPLVRDDRGSVVAGAHRLAAFHGTVYCDEHRVSHGDATGFEVRPAPDVPGVAVTVTGPRRLGGLRAGEVRHGRGRATQVGCRPAAALRDGVPDDRPVERRSWYRHVEDWWLVRP